MKNHPRPLFAPAIATLLTFSACLPTGSLRSQEAPAETPASPSPEAEETEPEPLRINRYPSYYYGSRPLTPQPEVILRFNAAVSEEAARSHFAFRDRQNRRRIPVEISRPSPDAVKHLQPYGGDDPKNLLPPDHFLLLEPLTPLPVGVEWHLEMKAGLASADGKFELRDTRTDRLGTLHAFVISNAGAVNHYDQPKSIVISMNKRLHQSISSEVLAGFVDIRPRPESFSVESRHSGINLKGDFQNGTSYTVSVMAGLVGHDLTRLEHDFSKSVRFEANPGFITLPAFTKAQNASGSRRFDISTGNLGKLRVRVKQLSDRDLVYALRGYDKLYEGHGGNEPKIPFDIVPGRIIYDREFPRKSAIDQSEKITLDWPALLKDEPHAGLYICAEGTSATRNDFFVGAQAIIQLTDIGLAWKQNGDETLVYAFSLETGRPLPDLPLQLLDGEAEPLAEFSTDDSGVSRIPGAQRTRAKWLAARRGTDRHVLEFGESLRNLNLWQFSLPYRYSHDEAETERRALIFTDRPVYKPGERVHLKCLTRLTDFDTLLPPEGSRKSVELRVYDARRRVIHKQTLTLSEHGSVEDSFHLPEEKTLGWYSATLDFSDSDQDSGNRWRNQFHHRFQVAEYRPNTFEITMDAEDAYPAGKALSIPVAAKYYLGKPLSKAELQWHVRAVRDYPRVKGFEGFVFGDSRHNLPPFTASQAVRLDDTGTARVEFELPDPGERPAPVRITVNAEITDINQQTVAESTSFRVDTSAFYLGLRTPEGVHRAGESVEFSLAAVRADGELHPEPVETTVKIEKLTYNTVKVRAAGGRHDTRSEEQLSEISEQVVPVVTRPHEETGIPLPTIVPLTFPDGGDYLVTAIATDGDGKAVLTRILVRIFGAGERNWRHYSDNVRIEVKADRDSYRVGETAKLLVRSPILGHALITTERGGVQLIHTQPITEHESVVEIPIAEGAAPNLFASVMIIRGSADSTHRHPNTDFRVGFCQLDVADPASELDIAIESDHRPYALPGSAVEIAAVVRDHRGNPVPDTEVTLYAVDEGVLSLTGYATPDPASTFHAPFPLAVHTGQSISDLLSEDPLEQDWSNKGYVIGGGGEEAGPAPTRVRKNFRALAFWGGSMLTGPDGRILASFTAPDNLTTYRIMAVASEGNRFGSASEKLVINKPLVLEPALPAFGNVADLLDLSAVLHNNTDDALDLELRVDLDRHAEFLRKDRGTATRHLRIPAGGTEAVKFPVSFTRVGEAKWHWRVAAADRPELADAVESTLEIGYPVPFLRGLDNLTLTDPDAPRDLLSSIDSKLLHGRGKVRLTLSNSRVLEAMDALNYLLRYPYGCVEQTTSSTLPWLTTRNLRPAIPQLDRSDEEVAAAIEAGTKRLLSMQTREGGLSYWPGGTQPSPWGSAYGGLALALAKKGGTKLPEDRLAKIWDYLSKNLRSSKDYRSLSNGYQRCLAAWTLALAGRGEPAYHDLLFRQRDKLTRDARAVLALAMIGSAGDDRDAALDERIGHLLSEGESAPENDIHWYRASFTTSMQLAAWSKWDPLNSRTHQLVDELMDSPRSTRNAWGSTYLNAWSLFALTVNTEATAQHNAGTRCGISFGKENAEINFGRELAGQTLEFEFEGDHRKTPLELKLDTGSRIYAHVEVETQPDIASFEPVDNGFGITRTYHRVDAEGNVHPVKKLEIGDLVLVSLHLSIPDQDRYRYLAIDDPLPSVFEAINPEFKSRAGDQKTGLKGDWKRLPTNHTELRTERALFFCDYLSKGGDYAVEYLVRVVAPGEAYAPPAKIEAMYQPHRYGLSKTRRFEVKPLRLGEPKQLAGN